MSIMTEQGKKAKRGKEVVSQLPTEKKNQLLQRMSEQLLLDKESILAENKKDLEAGEKNGLSTALLDRLRLSEERLQGMADGFKQVAQLDDPIGEMLDRWTRPNGLQIEQVRVPIGVLGIIYEARPNVTADAVALCLKTGNAAFLRGSSSAYHSNRAIIASIYRAMEMEGVTTDAVQLAEDLSREAAAEMFTMNDYIDVLIPRGGAGLIQTVVKQSTIPVLETGVGNCHVYIDASASKEMGISIAVNAKTNRPSVCNAAETILLHEKWAKDHGKDLITALLEEDVEIRGDEAIQALSEKVTPATEDDWKEEYLDLTVAMKTVTDTEEAITPISGSFRS